jgi:hypothetical protein
VQQRDRLLIPFLEWPLASSEDRKTDWKRFLGLVAVRDGLQPIAGSVRRKGTPSTHWRPLLHNGDISLGLTAGWIAEAHKRTFSHPYTEYVLEGECWRLPGQLEHHELPQPARETLSELMVIYLREEGDRHFQFTIRHWRGVGAGSSANPAANFLA